MKFVQVIPQKSSENLKYHYNNYKFWVTSTRFTKALMKAKYQTNDLSYPPQISLNQEKFGFHPAIVINK